MDPKNKEIYYIVIATARTGSTLFFDLLKNNKIATSQPNQIHYEPFEMRLISNIEYKNLDLKKYIQETFDTYSIKINNQKISGFKIFIKQIENFLNMYNNVNDKKLTIEDFFESLPQNTKFLRITRRNKLRQAISLYKAMCTKKWLQNKLSPKRIRIVPLNFFKMYTYLKTIEEQEQKITILLHKLNINYITYEYEVFTQDFKMAIFETLQYLEIRKKDIKKQTNLEVQRNWYSNILYALFYLFVFIFDAIKK